MTTYYRMEGSEVWDMSGYWSLTAGGGDSGSVPTSTDDVVFGTRTNGYTITCDNGGPSNCKSLTITGTPILGSTDATCTLNVYGGAVALGNATTSNLYLTLIGTGAGTSSISQGSGWVKNLDIQGHASKTYNFTSNFTFNSHFMSTISTVNLNGNSLIPLSSAHNVNLYSGAWNLGGGVVTGNNVDVSADLNMGGGTIRAYGNVNISGTTVSAATGTLQFIGSTAQDINLNGKTFGTIWNDRTAGASGNLTYTAAFTCTTLKSTAGRASRFTHSITYNMAALDFAGATAFSTNTIAYTWNNTSGAQISVADINISWCTGTGTGLFRATGNWVNGGNNTGWTFAPPGAFRAAAFF
jgi:hypothetical protein